MFVLDEQEGPRILRDVPVTVSIAQDGGAVTKANLTLNFEVISLGEQETIIRAGVDGDRNADLLKRVVVGWGGVKNSAGDAVPFTEQALDVACNRADFRKAALEVYFKVASGGRARLGN